MKKLILFGAFFLIAPKFYSQTNSNFESGYSQGYQMVTNKVPEVIPENVDSSQKFNNNWATKYSDQNPSLSLQLIQRDGDHDTNLERQVYKKGFQRGKADGYKDLKANKKSEENTNKS